MITRLTLKHWRAYDDLTLDLRDGTTFIVAPNGIGKTSIILGLQWALFGDDGAIDSLNCIRAGAQETSATVDLRLHDGSLLKVCRSRRLKGRVSVTYGHDGSVLAPDEGVSLLEEEFGVSLEIAARLCSMLSADSGVPDSLDLRDHLYRAFGVADVLEAREDARLLLQRVRKRRTELTREVKSRISDRSMLEGELDSVVATEHSIVEQLRTAQAVAAARQARRDAHRAWNDFEERLAAYRVSLQQLIDHAAALSLQANTAPVQQLDREILQLAAQLDAAQSHRATAAGAVAAAEHALGQLGGEHESRRCPTCLRPFKDDELTDARDSQTRELDRHSATESDAQDEVAALQERLRQLERLGAQLAALPPPPQPPAEPRPDIEPESDALAEEIGSLHRQLGGLETRRKQVQAALADDDSAALAVTDLESAFRREALAEAAHRSLSATVDELTRTRIDPLADEIRWRWKRLFGSDGLQLRPDGSIVHVIGERELPWESMSGGERIWARLVTHLLVLATSTKLPFAWFDEPLEHLDPRARRAVAASLAAASTAGGPPQLIVTTYEHTIARQLSADNANTEIRYVRTRELPTA